MTKKKVEIQLWRPEKLIPYEKNAKVHDEEHVQKLADSLEELGQITPIVVNKKGVIIAGHGRRLAALKLGLDWVKVIVRDDIDDIEEEQMRLADNATAGLIYDDKLMTKAFKDLNERGVGVDKIAKATSVDVGDINKLLEDPSFAINMDEISININSDVEDLANENNQIEEDVDGEQVSLNKAFGFKSIPTHTVRKVNIFVGMIEEETGQSGPDALDTWLESYITND